MKPALVRKVTVVLESFRSFPKLFHNVLKSLGIVYLALWLADVLMV